MCVVNGGRGINIVGLCGDDGNFKNECMANSKEKSLFCHSRAGGNPDLDLSKMFKVNRYFKLLDSRLRGNDDMNVFNFIYYNRPSENTV